MNEEKIISVTPISKEENLYSREVADGCIFYAPIVAMVLIEYDSYNGGTNLVAHYSKFCDFAISNDCDYGRYPIGVVDWENQTFEPLEKEIVYENGKQQVSPYILLNSVEEIACDRFGNVSE